MNLDIDDGLGGIYAYGNNEANVPVYGRLYTWNAAMRVANSIDGWHLPGDAEWTTLIVYLGYGMVTGGKLKEAGTAHWASPNTGATNNTGFTALPGGFRYSDGTFDSIGYLGYWWNAGNVLYSMISYNSSSISRNFGDGEFGYSVRLIKDTP